MLLAQRKKQISSRGDGGQKYQKELTSLPNLSKVKVALPYV